MSEVMVADAHENDATDAAHPAWWRGHDYGTARTAETLLRVAKEGRVGKFGEGVEEAALEIERLQYQIRDRDGLLKNENELYRQAALRADAAEAVAEERRARAKAAELQLEGARLMIRELEQECVAYRAQLEGRLR